ncbi:hypothetical protein FIE12Z_1487 [Fusarium flagelliforme]|uniref:SnoaL-like domain-containing protein n=1 Tax=Fusarium flagelliforme TaxID=2675880 RepID=A0A395N2P2_9HYPO|nr:hypothetical protein FIE12Z_1487 [Fusarium flagelliforme]
MTPYTNWTSSRETLERGLESVLVGDPTTTRSDLEKFFTPNYTSIVDGKSVNFEEFVQHMEHLRKITTAISVQSTHYLRDGNQLAERHIATVEFANKPTARFEVFLFARVNEDGRIENLVETLRQFEGLEEDKDLGSARA